MPFPTWGSIPKDRPVYPFLQTWHLHENNFCFSWLNLAKMIQCRLTVKNDEIIRVSALNSVRNELSQFLMFLHSLFLNSLISPVIIYLTFCCFALILLVVYFIEECGVLVLFLHILHNQQHFSFLLSLLTLS